MFVSNYYHDNQSIIIKSMFLFITRRPAKWMDILHATVPNLRIDQRIKTKKSFPVSDYFSKYLFRPKRN